MTQENKKIIFHIDMDAFFASIEQRDSPEFKGKPVIVGALPGNRGVVSAASYEARKYGIHSSMPISQAYSRCPHGIYLRPRMRVYAKVSKEVMAILNSFSPQIEQISIDEAFMNMSGTQKLWGPPKKAAKIFTKQIHNTLQLTASIGIAPNKFLAKLASDMNKPNGITEVPFNPEEIVLWLAPLSVSKIWGVGKKTQQALAALGIRSISELQKNPLKELESRFGKQGTSLYNLCRGIDLRDIEGHEKAKSISREHTFNNDSYDAEEWYGTLLSLSGDVAIKSRKASRKGKTVVLTYRTPDFKRYTRHLTLVQPTNLSKHIYESACILLKKEIPRLKSLRLIGVGITNFDTAIQTDLFENGKKTKAWNASEEAMDIISNRYGKDAILRAREVTERKKKK